MHIDLDCELAVGRRETLSEFLDFALQSHDDDVRVLFARVNHFKII
jgi:hypothetical protein